jgi:SAM-dependent methyltransferase/uncharacterized coiled-coil protein SlyX
VPDDDAEAEASDAWRGLAWHLDEADAVAHGGTEVPATARLRPLKKALVVGSSPLTSYQVEFNRHLLAGTRDLANEVDQRDTALRAELATEGGSIDRLEAVVHEQAATIEALTATVEALATRLDDATDTVAELQAGQDALLRAGAGSTPGRATEGPAAAQATTDELEARLGARRSVLYRNLERTFRGSREDVTAMLRGYLPDVEDLGAPVLDIGCGRGEWLELLRDAGVAAYGVDLNDTFVADNQARGLDVRNGDAIEHLRSLGEGTLGAITGFHIAEHLPFEVLLDLFDAARRALRPGGSLILETPNPQNLIVGAANFWIDPTHLKPLHPLFLEFLALERGFASTELRWLHPHPMADLPFLEGLPDTAANRQVRTELAGRLFGPMDYALVATRAGHDTAVERPESADRGASA